MAANDQLVKVGGLLSGEAVEAQVGQDERVSLYRPVGAAILRDPPGIGVAGSEAGQSVEKLPDAGPLHRGAGRGAVARDY